LQIFHPILLKGIAAGTMRLQVEGCRMVCEQMGKNLFIWRSCLTFWHIALARLSKQRLCSQIIVFACDLL
jgi:hypothetical protein